MWPELFIGIEPHTREGIRQVFASEYLDRWGT